MMIFRSDDIVIQPGAGRIRTIRPALPYWARGLAWVAFAFASAATSTIMKADTSLDSIMSSFYMHFAAEQPAKVQETLQRISTDSRRYLALAYYMRRADEIQDGWSWTTAEVRSFRKTLEYREMVEDVERVRTIFAERNPGYSLRVNIAARSLGSQITKWNRVSSVSRAVHDFLDSAEIFITSMVAEDSLGVAGVPEEARVDSFRWFLTTYGPKPGRVPTVAVPGLSKHGQLRAFDFKVYRGRRMLAGANSGSIRSKWERPGWTERLREAAALASPRFVGPLPVPYEPWHYNYDAERPRFPAAEADSSSTIEVDTSHE